MSKTRRWVISVYLDSFYTKTSGDTFTEGEFYFKCNGHRFPAEGEIKLDKDEKFDPEPDPSIYFEIKQTKADKTKLKIEVLEKDPGMDDTFIKETLVVPLKDGKQTIKLTNKDETCKLKGKIYIKETEKW